MLLLAKNPHGGEHLKDLLAAILWVNPAQLPLVALVYAGILALWSGAGAHLGRIGFCAIFACMVTVPCSWSVVPVFVTLVGPALATWYARRRRLLKGYLIGCAGYALGLLASLVSDLPSGPTIVCAITLIGFLVFASGAQRAPQ